ncbi:MAG: phage holin family protein [Firmicutes bacterium]|nr:phage holin family protein [Bacillota bacterium]
MGLMLRWGLNILCILITANLVSGFNVTFGGAVFGSVVLGIANAAIRPVVLLLTLPINLLTLGLFTLVVNGLMLWITSALVRGFEITGFGTAIIAALILSICSFIVSLAVKEK